MAWPRETLDCEAANPVDGQLAFDGDFTDLLVSQVHTVGEAVLQYDAEIKELQREVAMAPADLAVVSEENAVLAKHAQRGLEEVAALSSAHSALSGEADGCRRKAQDLQAERDMLRVRVNAAERQLANARLASDSALKSLDVERRQADDWRRDMETELERRRRRAVDVEQGACEAECNVGQLEAMLAGSRSEATTASRVVEAETKRRRQQIVQLEERVRAQQAVALRNASGQRARELSEELAKARSEAFAFEDVEEVLSAELMDSESNTEETERKALSVARELLETSHAMARLRAEVATQRTVRSEMDDARRDEGALEQRLLEAEAAATTITATTTATTADAAWRHLQSPGKAGSSGSACTPQDVLGRSPISIPASQTAADIELRDARVAQERALNEALSSAWEAEAKDRRETERRLNNLEGYLSPLRLCLIRLSSAVERGRETLTTPAELDKPAPVTAPPSEAAFGDIAQLPNALATLCDCVDELASVSLRSISFVSARGSAESAGGAVSCRGNSFSGRRPIGGIAGDEGGAGLAGGAATDRWLAQAALLGYDGGFADRAVGSFFPEVGLSSRAGLQGEVSSLSDSPGSQPRRHTLSRDP
eukprot:TRINITY_DN62287_c0_g1_i1.p1 TRINITY_DN62287_c0_g1~~TRINITY_DN62287_c0_g1_i1.p1  ORF type:complete len:601 (-),score=141.82 TRINITY_DN62287_c0_g1_i1:215-2017(-)